MNDSEFGLEKQKLLIEYILANETVFQRCYNILKADYFDKELEPAVRYILQHANDFTALPTLKQIEAETDIRLDDISKVRNQDENWALTNIEKFCQRMAIVQAVWKSPDFIEKGNYGAVEDIVRAAMDVGLQKDLGTNYFEDPRERLERMRLKNLIPTGWFEVDRRLYGGFNRGELSIFTAGSGVGKSLFLQNLCLNWIEGARYMWSGEEKTYEPLNVVYITLELSEELTSKRLDSMITGIDARDIFKKLEEIELKVKMKDKETGNLQLKYMSPGSNVNDIKAYLKELEIEKEWKADAVVVDYLDLLYPTNRKIDVGDLFIKDKFVTEQLRSMASDLDILCATAAQLNRSAVDESEHSQAMIGGGISKIQTADNVISVYASVAMKERGEFQCQFLKTRSSAGVGKKAWLGFDVTSMRIFNDTREREEDKDKATELRDIASKSSDDLLEKIKKPTQQPIVRVDEPTEPEEEPEIAAETPIERLKRLQDANKL